MSARDILPLCSFSRWLALFPFLVAGSALAQALPDENELLGRGFSPEKLYDFQDIDSVNLFSGNLALTIPLGGTYPVGGKLSYRFTLTYNSRAWSYNPCPFPFEDDHQEAVATPLANAGLGWMVTLGYLVPPGHPVLNSDGQWLYVSPDGGQHLLFESLHTDDTPVAGVWYSRDNSYLRLQEDAGGLDRHELEFPDGTIHTFEVGVHDASVWELTEIRDPFNNKVTVDREAPDIYHWTVSDDHLRIHEIVFVNDPSPPGGLLRPRIASITLEGFQGEPAAYTFNYAEPVSVERGCRNTCLGSSPSVAVPLLTSVTLPSGEIYSFGTEASPDYELTCAQEASGAVRSATLPTLGKIAWTWGQFCMPRDREFGGAGGAAAFLCDGAVKERRLIAPDGTASDPWVYDNATYPEVGGCVDEANCDDATETQTVVVQPTGDCNKHYFAANPGPTGANAWSYGLPFSPSTSSAGLLLSSEVWKTSVATGQNPNLPHKLQVDCAETPAGGGEPLRSAWVLYEKDNLPSQQYEDGREFHNTNRRLVQTRTTFEDATNEITAVSSNFDGEGHYRQTVFDGNFPGSNDRTTFTNFNPTHGTYPGTHSHPSPSSPWILETFDKTEVTEAGATARVEYCFEAATGFLLRRRALLDTLAPLARNNKDVLEVFDHGNSGNRTRERYFGGDTAPTIGTGDLCPLIPPTGTNLFDYQIEHSYEFGALEKSFYAITDAGGTIGFTIFDVDRDGSSGLVARSRDSSGLIPTDYEYDAMGRLTAEIPAETPAQRARTDYTYTNALGLSPATVTLEKTSSGGSLLAESEVEFDGFGRIAAERRLMPDGTTAERRTTFNARGWPLTQTEWDPICTAPCGVTTFSGHDPFGRPGTITAPDQTTTTFAYEGTSRVDRTVSIQGAGSVTTREVYDRFGRLSSVEEPIGTNAFTYAYDEGDRLVNVTSTGPPVQTRTFDYDGRGFLLTETHPELGGAVEYTVYDARGHAGDRKQKNGAAVFQELLFTWDKGERLLSVTDAVPNPDRALKSFAYDDSAGSSRLDGRLRQAVRHNWVDVPWDGTTNDVDVTVTETYVYDGAGAAVSRRTTNTNRESLQFVVDWTYDQLGNVSTIVHPDCQLAATCPGIEAITTVQNTYTNGLLTAVGTPSNPQVYAHSITYHPNGLWSTIRYNTSSGVLDTQTIADDAMRRPRRLQVGNLASGTPFDTGDYGYDGAGNVASMGTHTFTYDSRSRLASAFVHGYTQSFTYDFYGNLTSYVTTPPGGGQATTTISTNSATNRLSGSTPTASYDAAGNVTHLSGYDYRYDALEMETRRHLAGSQAEPQWTNIYTADDERLWILSRAPHRPPGEPSFGGAANQAIYVRDLGGRVLRQYAKIHQTEPPNPAQLWLVRGDYIYRDGTLLVTAPAGSTAQHHHVDHLGTIRQTTDVSRNVISSPNYLPFGEGAPTSVVGQAMQFTGHERELHGSGEIDNLDYLHARYRSPVYARFLSVDPIPQTRRAQKAPQFWNRYAYARDNPLIYVDPSGRIALLWGDDEERKKTLGALRNSVPLHLRMFVRTTTNKHGQTQLDERYLRMGASVDSGNFRAILAVAASEKAFAIGTSAREVATSQGTQTLERGGATGIFLDQGGLSPRNDMSSVLVAGNLTQRETSEALAHEMRHASFFAQGLPFQHEDLVEVAPGVFSPTGPVTASTVAAEREARENFDPFYPQD